MLRVSGEPLEPLRQHIRPAIVSVRRGPVTVGDGVPEGHHGLPLPA